MLKGKKIVLGITGSIAAYKACNIIRLLVKRGAEVQVVITPAGKEFITPITLSALTQKPVISDFFSQRDGTWHSHVALGLWADAMLVAPCTASTLGKMAHAIADNMLITTYLSMKAPVFVAPAMDLDMFAHPSTKANLALIESYGNHIIEPQSGFLASGLEGKGRMEEPEAIVDALDAYFDSLTPSLLRGKRVLITGKMGFAIAEECRRRGAEVVLVAGPVSQTCHKAIRRVDVESCEEMFNAANEAMDEADIAVMAAAVADYRPAVLADRKIKREKTGAMTLDLLPTHDIAAALGAKKRDGQLLVGFALETDNAMANAQEKLVRKNLDMIVVNSLQNEGTCFQSDNNKVTIMGHGFVEEYDKKPKSEVAKDIADQLEALLQP